MDKYAGRGLEDALKIVSSTIIKCEKIQPKFPLGSSQYTLLKNRIKALYISKALISNENIMAKYTREELLEALPPLASIISKCEKAQQKYKEGTSYHTRFKKMIDAMNLAKELITDAINETSQ